MVHVLRMREPHALKATDQYYARRLAGTIRAHAQDPVAALEDPLESALFSLLIKRVKEQENSP